MKVQDLATYWVGKGVGLMNQSISSDVVQEFKEDFINAFGDNLRSWNI